MIATTTAADLLPAICDPENFGDDGLRLAYADLLEEEGESDRAEFVRVQVELARDWGEVNEQGIKDGLTDAGRRRHPRFASLVRRERQLQAPGRRWWSDYGPGDRVTVREWRRGFARSVALACADWLAHGPALVRRQPVEAVRLSDREPRRVDQGPWAGEWFYVLRDIPGALWGALASVDMPRVFAYFPGREAAEAALSEVCLSWARSTGTTP
jgi:uncharacterized protein (TIGR02996 family)